MPPTPPPCACTHQRTLPERRAPWWGCLCAAALLLAACPPTVPPERPDAVRPSALPKDISGLLAYAAAERARATAGRGFWPLHALNALRALEKARTLSPRNRRVLLGGAEVARDLAERASSKGAQLGFARRGLAFTRAGRRAFPREVAFHYLHAALLGLKVDAYRASAMGTVPRLRAAAEQAVKLDRGYHHAGPLRVLGSLLVQVPETAPFHGDIERGTALLEEAVRRAPQYPLNHLFLADAYAKDEEDARAAAHYRTVLCAPLSRFWDAVLAARYRKRAARQLRALGQPATCPHVATRPAQRPESRQAAPPEKRPRREGKAPPAPPREAHSFSRPGAR